MNLKNYLSIDQKLYYSFVIFFTLLISVLLFNIFIYFGFEGYKYSIGKIRIISYLFTLFLLFNILSISMRISLIKRIIRDGITANAEIIKNLKVRNDHIDLYILIPNQNLICSIRRSRKNKDLIDSKFIKGESVVIKHIGKKAILVDYYE